MTNRYLWVIEIYRKRPFDPGRWIPAGYPFDYRRRDARQKMSTLRRIYPSEKYHVVKYAP